MENFTHFLARHWNEAWLESVVDRGFRIVVIIAAMMVGAKTIQVVTTQILSLAHAKASDGTHSKEREKRLATVVKLVNTTLRVVLFSFATLMILREIGLDITPLLTGAGIAGVAVGFGAQSLVKDMISGFFILIEDQIRIGDVIKVNGGLSGAVERMELRVTAIRDGDGTLHIIPNGEIKSVSNMTYEFARAVVALPLPYQVDLKSVKQILEKVIVEFEGDPQWKMELRSRPEFQGITEFQPEYLVIQITATTEPHCRSTVARELRARALAALDEAGTPLRGAPGPAGLRRPTAAN